MEIEKGVEGGEKEERHYDKYDDSNYDYHYLIMIVIK